MPIHIIKFKIPEEQDELKHSMDGWKWKAIVDDMFSQIHQWEENSVKKVTPDCVRETLVRIRNEYLDD